jgi:hypothetical protein
VSRPLPAITRRWMSIALIALVLIAVGFAIWG